MSTKPKPPSASSGGGAAPILKNAAAAPFIYFDGVPLYGTYAGNLEVELAARQLMPKADGTVASDIVCTAHLRMGPSAAVMLIDALQKALDMYSKQQEQRSELLQS
ncbi:MAG: hypothetical protein PS018_20325 [bacterium]|nr:hypothetical protein [bacterium]